MSSTHGEARNEPSNPYAQKWYGHRITASKHAEIVGEVESTSSVPRCMQRFANAPRTPLLSRTSNTRSPPIDVSRYEPGMSATESARPAQTHDVANARR